MNRTVQNEKRPVGGSAETGGQARLFLVATPIGNLDDISNRAVKVLAEVELIAAEDTRRTRRLLSHLGLSKPLVSYYRHNQVRREEVLLNELRQGKSIALVSDAGMPGISDPGARLVEAAVREGIPVTPIPGPAALTAALAASGLPADRFVFEGFLPRSGRLREECLKRLAAETRTIVIYEAPHRIRETLSQLRRSLGDERRIVIARELTKVYEEFWRGTLREAELEFTRREPKGEFTLVVEGAAEKAAPAADWPDLVAEVEEHVRRGIPASEAVRTVAGAYGVSRRRLYEAFQEKRRSRNGG